MAILLGSNDQGAVALEHKTLLRHMACLGSSGSGKTVLCKALCEGLGMSSVPVIALDPQGDIASLIRRADPARLREHGAEPERADEFHRKTEVVIWTPGSTAGIPLCVNPLQFGQLDAPVEQQVRALSLISKNLASLMGYDPESDDGRYASALFNVVFEFCIKDRIVLGGFDELADLMAAMPAALKRRALRIASAGRIESVIRELRLLTLGIHRLLFSMGVPLSVERLLGRDTPPPEGVTRLSVVYLNTLNAQEEKEFFVAQLVQQLYDWMLANPSSDLQALFYIDEIAPYLPPVRKPACRDGLRLLFKQARKYGVGCLIATQNPGDVDYKSLAQFSTWALGRLMVRQDIQKVEKIVRSLAPKETDAILSRLPTLQAGQFLLICPDQFDSVVDLKMRWLYTDHGTLDEEQLAGLIPAAMRERFAPLALDPFAKESAESGPAGEEAEAPALAEAEPPGEKETAETDATSERVVQFLADAGEPQAASAIAERLGIAEGSVRRALASLRASGRVNARQVGRRNVYWAGDDRSMLVGLDAPVLVARDSLPPSELVRVIEAQLEMTYFFQNEEVEETADGWLCLWRFVPGMVSDRQRTPAVAMRKHPLYVEARSGRLCVIGGGNTLRFAEPEGTDPERARLFTEEYGFEAPGEKAFPYAAALPADVLTAEQMSHLIEIRYGVKPQELSLAVMPTQAVTIRRKNERTQRTIVLEKAHGRLVSRDD